jgi:type I pantothenate kinase
MVIPIYDHFRYDVSPTERHVLTRADVVVIEGLCLLGPGAECAIGPIAEPLDLTIYVDADAADIEAWHRARFVANARRAAAEPGGFWDLFSGFDDVSLDAAAAYTWDEINAENLRSHVLPGRGDADIVVTKAADHSIVGIHPNPEH